MQFGAEHFPFELVNRLSESGLFDADWYRCYYPDVDASGLAPLAHFCELGWMLGRRPGPLFSPQDYLQQHPDVDSAGIDPLLHYLRYSEHESRSVSRDSTKLYHHYLWRGLHDLYEPLLKLRLTRDDLPVQDRFDAIRSLCGWLVFNQRHAEAAAQCSVLWQEPGPHKDIALLLLYVQCCVAEPALLDLHGGVDSLLALLADYQKDFPEYNDLWLAQSNVLLLKAESESANLESRRLEVINTLYQQAGLSCLQSATGYFYLDTLTADALAASSPAVAKVSVIVPVYNAEAYLRVAVQSLVKQSWSRLEIILIDDASQDGSAELCDALVPWVEAAGVEIQVVHNGRNQGAYAVRNQGMARCTGDYITVHDADDWSHPQKIEWQANALEQDQAKVASLSDWVRCDEQMRFSHWRTDSGWIYRNTSSLLFRRSVLQRLGFWDEVKVNADTEYLQRISKAYGKESIVQVLPGVPLAFGRMRADALTQRGGAHLITQFIGVRKLYQDAAQRWHARSTHSSALYMPQSPEKRPFRAPLALLNEAKPVQDFCFEDALQQSGIFDPVWYLYRYADVRERIQEPFEHFITQGAALGYEPGPVFSLSGYQYANHLDQSGSDADPLSCLTETFFAQAWTGEPVALAGQPAAVENSRVILVLCQDPEALYIPLLRWLHLLRNEHYAVVLVVPGRVSQLAELRLMVDQLLFYPALSRAIEELPLALAPLINHRVLQGTRLCAVTFFECIFPLNAVDVAKWNTLCSLKTEKLPFDFIQTRAASSHATLADWCRAFGSLLVDDAIAAASWSHLGRVDKALDFINRLNACDG